LGIWNDGGSDCIRTNNSNYANSGTYSIRIRDNSSSSTLTTDNLDLSSASQLTVNFSYQALSMEPGEDFWLQVSTNGGATYNTVQRWASGSDFNNNQRMNESVNLSGPFSANTQVRFRCDASTNSDNVYLDDITLSATCGSAQPVDDFSQPFGKLEEEKKITFIENLYPNPTRDRLTVVYNLAKAEDINFVITDFTGKQIQMKKVEGMEGSQKFELDTRAMAAGFYFVHLINGENRIAKKFVVVK